MSRIIGIWGLTLIQLRQHPERIIQYNIVNWLRQKHPDIIFMANIAEQKATPAWHEIKDRMGFRKGVSDLFFPASNSAYKGLWLELKTLIGKATETQHNFIEDMIKLGYAGFITFGYNDAEKTIRWFYNLPD